MIGTTANTTSTFVSTPITTVNFHPAADPRPKVDLYHVAYYRDNTSYEDLLKALLQKVSGLQKHLAAIGDR